MCNYLRSFGFGNVPHDGLIARTKVGVDERADLPESFSEHLIKWSSWAKKKIEPIYDVKLAGISFGYGGEHYTLKPDSLQVDDARFELAAADILKDMEQLGCDYGVYIGYMD